MHSTLQVHKRWELMQFHYILAVCVSFYDTYPEAFLLGCVIQEFILLEAQCVSLKMHTSFYCKLRE
jgi:hypothetical protein